MAISALQQTDDICPPRGPRGHFHLESRTPESQKEGAGEPERQTLGPQPRVNLRVYLKQPLKAWLIAQDLGDAGLIKCIFTPNLQSRFHQKAAPRSSNQ